MRKMKVVIMIFFSCFSIKGYTINDSLVISSFSQGNANNCASIALIKAAMLKYGYNGVFSFKEQAEVYKIMLRDKTSFSITKEELKQAKSYSKFEISSNSAFGSMDKDSVLFYVYLSYACIAKYIQQNGYYGCTDNSGKYQHIKRIKSYEKALLFISRMSFCTDNCYRLLGLRIKENKIFDYKENSDLVERGIILYSWRHAVAVYNSQIDCYGDWIFLKECKGCSNKFEFYFVLE